MNDRQQLAAMGEHMREMEKCEQDVRCGLVDALSAISADWGVPVSMLTGNSAAEFKVPDGWKLVPVEPTCYQVLVGRNADSMDDEPCVAVYLAMLAAAPEYKP